MQQREDHKGSKNEDKQVQNWRIGLGFEHESAIHGEEIGLFFTNQFRYIGFRSSVFVGIFEVEISQEIHIEPLVVFAIEMPSEAIVTSIIFILGTFGLESRSFDTTDEAHTILILLDFLFGDLEMHQRHQ